MAVSSTLPALVDDPLPAARAGAHRRGVLRPLRSLSDERLSGLAARGDDDAFAVIDGRYRLAIVRYCSSILLNQADAEDAAQTTMVNARGALGRRGESVRLRPWLFRIAHNEAVSLLRSRRPSEPLDALEATLPARGEDALAVRARTHSLIADLLELPERQRAALLMRELVGLSYGEIAVALGGTAAAVTQSVFEGRRNLAQIEHGRSLDCAVVQRSISDGDARRLRGRAVRAHLQDCRECTGFASTITQRTVTLTLIFPLATKGALIAGTGAFGAGGAPAAMSALGGAGAPSVVKAAAVAAVLAGVGAGGVALQHSTVHRPPAHRAKVVHRSAPPRLAAAIPARARTAEPGTPAHHVHHHRRRATRPAAVPAPPPALHLAAGGVALAGASAHVGPAGVGARVGGASADVGPKGIAANAPGVGVQITPGCIVVQIAGQAMRLGDACPPA